MIILTSFPWYKPKGSQGQVQQPIPYFIGTWDDFMVHGVKNPLLMEGGWSSFPNSQSV